MLYNIGVEPNTYQHRSEETNSLAKSDEEIKKVYMAAIAKG
jgi:hypothetical protein